MELNDTPLGAEKNHGGRVTPQDHGGRVDPPFNSLQTYDRSDRIKCLEKPFKNKRRFIMRSLENESQKPVRKRRILSKIFVDELTQRRREEERRKEQEVVWIEYEALCNKATEEFVEAIRCQRCVSPVVKMKKYGLVCRHLLSSALEK